MIARQTSWYRCRLCSSEYNLGHYARRRDSYAQSNKKHYQANKEIIKARAKKWREDNHGYIYPLMAKKALEWYRNNTERAKKNAKAYAKTENGRAIKTATDNTRRTRMKGNGGKFTGKEWQALKKFYNYTCLCCGKQEPEIKLTADHVLPVAKGDGSSIDNIQPLCRSCNSRKGNKYIDYRI